MKKFLIAAASSGSGKTTLTMGLLRRLRNMGLNVQPFKCGPDYIDTKWHTLAAGRESVNLDLWMSSKEHVKSMFEHYSADADVCVVEGVMGLFDGWKKSAGSCAEIAKLCDLPVVLVVNAKSTAYSVAPLIYGFKHFDPEVKIAGVLFNQVGSDSHYEHLKEACKDAGVECLGYMRRNKDIELPSRHLGLTIDEKLRIDSFIDKVAENICIEEMVRSKKVRSKEMACRGGVCPPCQEFRSPEIPLPGGGVRGGHLISVARDEAFNFTYRANIDALKQMGEVRFFSPMTDEKIPDDTDLLYLPGGYPEFFLKELTANKTMLRSIHDYIEGGGRAYAECGGMLYLCRNIIEPQGKSHDMAGVLNLEATFKDMHLHLGYRKMTIAGKNIKGHEFHYSEVHSIGNGEEIICTATNATGKNTGTPLYRHKNLIAGYTHLYWGETDIFRLLFDDFQ